MKKISTKVMMWVFTITSIFLGASELFSSQSAAELGWGKANVLPHDKFYEQYIGITFFCFAIIGFGIAMYTSGKVQAKLTLLVGAIVAVSHIGTGVIASQSDPSYSSDPISHVPVVILLILLFASGYQGLKSAD